MQNQDLPLCDINCGIWMHLEMSNTMVEVGGSEWIIQKEADKSSLDLELNNARLKTFCTDVVPIALQVKG